MPPFEAKATFVELGAGLTVVGVPRFASFVPSVTSVAVTVNDPSDPKVKLNTRSPLARAAFAGRVALPSLDVIATTSFVTTGFQNSSQPIAVTLKADPLI